MALTAAQQDKSPSRLIDGRIAELGDWRGAMLSRIRALIKKADPDVVEEWKWRGVPVWSHAGIICTGETYKQVVKLNLRQRRLARGSEGPLQLQPRRECATRDRHPRGRYDRRAGAQGPYS